jgi:hypothetical protein
LRAVDSAEDVVFEDDEDEVELEEEELNGLGMDGKDIFGLI